MSPGSGRNKRTLDFAHCGTYSRIMRSALLAVVSVLLIAAGVEAQLGPVLPKQAVDDWATKSAQELGDRAKRATLGILNDDANLEFRRLGEAVRLWKKEKDAGAAPLLAEGVLFDCLGRLQNVKTRPLLYEEWGGPYADTAALRLIRANKAFDAALKVDPGLIEARMRGARIRGSEDSRAALELERIAQGTSVSPFAYLAAISRAAIAHAKHDIASATRWYERALELNPQSTAAAIGLGSLRPAALLSFNAIDADDLYYTYPCTVLTAKVNAALSVRVQNVALK